MNANKLLYQMCEGCADYGHTVTLKEELDIYHRGCQIECPVLPDCQCPCITCIVKGICIDVCDEFREYKNKSHNAVMENAHKYGVKHD